MTSIKSRDWNAWIDLMPGSQTKLHVTGEVETNAGNLVPKLAEAVPQGINPKILILVLTIETEGDVGTDDVAFRPARFEKPAGKGQYVQVDIRFDDNLVAAIDVTETH
jgi:hypothetical protein